MILAEFVPRFAFASELAQQHFNILAAIAFILGAGNFFRVHGEKVYKQQAGWGYSGIALVAFLLMLSAGLFKLGVQGRPGYVSKLEGANNAVGFATLDINESGGGQLNVLVRGAPAGQAQPVALVLGGRETLLGEIKADERGAGALTVKCDPKPDQKASPQLPAVLLKTAQEGQTVEIPGEAQFDIKVGGVVSGTLSKYSRYTGEVESNGTLFWYLYEYIFQPLQQTMFAMLAFYVASAAFRAFRARNIESVLLLGTAFIVLLGRTYVGTVMTDWLPVEGFLSFFRVPELTGWIMAYLATAGTRAIMIGIALGVAATSLKVLLGIDRSYLGSDSK